MSFVRGPPERLRKRAMNSAPRSTRQRVHLMLQEALWRRGQALSPLARSVLPRVAASAKLPSAGLTPGGTRGAVTCLFFCACAAGAVSGIGGI
jgi:hypothetical protein